MSVPVRKLNLSELEWLPYAIAPGIGGEVRDVGRAVGTKNIGLRIQRIPPGARASRRHRHLFQEELLVVVRGEGTLIHGDERSIVRSTMWRPGPRWPVGAAAWRSRSPSRRRSSGRRTDEHRGGGLC